jgi:hypothetical protein
MLLAWFPFGVALFVSSLPFQLRPPSERTPLAVDVKVVAASYVTRLRDFSVLLTWPPWLG